jgi:hypothetical protein
MDNIDSQYIVDPSETIAKMCSEDGLFLEDDYYIAMSHYEVPDSYWRRIKNTEKTDRKIVILGSQEAPMTITKNAFLAQTLAKPKKLTIKTSNADEAILLKEMYAQNKKYNDCDFAVYHNKKEELASNGAWLRDIEEATDVIVYSGMDTISFFHMKSSEKQNFYLHRPKFSFGIVTKDCLDDEDLLAGLVGDFISFFGEGTMAPRFYITLGKLSEDQMLYIADCMKNEEDLIKEFRSKLPLSKRTFMIHEMTFSNFAYPYVRTSSFYSPEFISPLFGDVRLIQAKNESEIINFLEEYENTISTVALNEETLGDFVARWDYDVPRFCDIGSMQFPYFYEPFDDIDDLEIYGEEIGFI